MNKVPRWVFRYVGNKTFDFSSKKKDFLPKNDQIWPKTGIFGQFGPGHAGLFNALLWVGLWLWRAGCISQDTYLFYLNEADDGINEKIGRRCTAASTMLSQHDSFQPA